MTEYKNLEELVTEYIEQNTFLTIEEAEEIRSCTIVIEDIVSSGCYTELEDGSIIVH